MVAVDSYRIILATCKYYMGCWIVTGNFSPYASKTMCCRIGTARIGALLIVAGNVSPCVTLENDWKIPDIVFFNLFATAAIIVDLL